ncbi:hypothetical protein [endosymbiont GvMRE of Glomus versiforme]|uniref:hypothetical protein n=1 Tax=endosymbiont GvMRE of Glomus versiforme TaxID=2039283 RepID=UPI000EEB3DCF|nr:hypothetical protein [endosymbiont GvMRE of Glomus versiforme]RHZ36584.1 hypothetical protein GvMRE_I2g528 [endosymbiont GvMRE of Glomus versiforme]RHZ36918.1 hypothetical protein GvMRE_I2g638 [endosymbiont GvMRE of Glomus versiforme]
MNKKACVNCQKQSSIWHYIYDPDTKKIELSLADTEPQGNQLVFCSKDCYEEKFFPEKKKEQHKLSHCAVCDKKSAVYHYIWDKRTKVLEESMSNATNPDHQWVFCTEKHFKQWESQRKQEAEKELNLTWNKLNSEKGNLEVPNFPTLEELRQKQEKEELESYIKQILQEIQQVKQKANVSSKTSNIDNKNDKSFFEKNKVLVIIGGIGILALIGGLVFWIVKLKKGKEN